MSLREKLRARALKVYDKVSIAKYEEATKLTGDIFRNIPEESILEHHVSSKFKTANLHKVKTRMLKTYDFIIKNIKDDISGYSFLDIGGTSDILFKILGVDTENGAFANILPQMIASSREKGYAGYEVTSELLPCEDDSFDYCISLSTLEHTFNPLMHLSEMRRVSKKGIFVSIPHRHKTIVVKKKKDTTAFDQHILEFSHSDFHLIAEHCNLRIEDEKHMNLHKKPDGLLDSYLYRNAGWHKPDISIFYLEKS